MKVRSWSSETPSSISHLDNRRAFVACMDSSRFCEMKLCTAFRLNPLHAKASAVAWGRGRNRFAHVYDRRLWAPASQQMYTCGEWRHYGCSKAIDFPM